jgi:hypothetical protein
MKSFLLKYPEYLLILLLLLAAYSPPFFFNPVFLVLAALVVLQLIIKNRVTGILIGIAFLLGNLLFLGALFSELSEFSSFNSDTLQLCIGGLMLWIICTAVSLAMIYKYSAGYSERII